MKSEDFKKIQNEKMKMKEVKKAVVRGGSFLVIVGAALGLGFLGKLGWEGWLQKQMAANVVAADQVAFYLEVSWNDDERAEWNKLFERWGMWQVESLERGVSDWLGLTEPLKNLSRVAVVLTPEREIVLLVEDFPSEVLTKMEEEWGGEWNEDVVNAKERAVSWTQRSGFTILGRNEEVLQKVLEGDDLGSDGDFARVRDGVPTGVAFAYFDGEKLMGDGEMKIDLWRPVAELISRGGVSLQIEDGGILAKSKTIYGGGVMNMASKIFSRVKSMKKGDLAELFPKETWMFWESSDLQNEWEDWEKVLSGSAPVLAELISNRVEYWEEGTGLSLKDDVLQMADGSFAIGFLPENGVVFVSENDEEFLRDKMGYFEDLLLRRVPAMFPEVAGVQGAFGKTVQAVKVGKEPVREEFEIDGISVAVVDFEGEGWDLVWTVTDGKLILANSKQAMTDLLVARSQDGGMLAENEAFERGEAFLSGMKSDLVFVSMKELNEWLSEKWQGILAPFENVSGGKNLLDLESVATWFFGVR